MTQQKAISWVFYSRPFKGGQWALDYYPVAFVTSLDLQTVFKVTQHICPECFNEGELDLVHWIQPARSMCVGDVVVNSNGTFRCMPSGWQQI